MPQVSSPRSGPARTSRTARVGAGARRGAAAHPPGPDQCPQQCQELPQAHSHTLCRHASTQLLRTQAPQRVLHHSALIVCASQTNSRGAGSRLDWVSAKQMGPHRCKQVRHSQAHSFPPPPHGSRQFSPLSSGSVWASPDCTRVPAKLERWKLTLFRTMLIILAGLCAYRGALGNFVFGSRLSCTLSTELLLGYPSPWLKPCLRSACSRALEWGQWATVSGYVLTLQRHLIACAATCAGGVAATCKLHCTATRRRCLHWTGSCDILLHGTRTCSSSQANWLALRVCAGAW